MVIGSVSGEEVKKRRMVLFAKKGGHIAYEDP